MKRVLSAVVVSALFLASCKPSGYVPYKSRFPSKDEREKAAIEAQRSKEQAKSLAASEAYSQDGMRLAVDEVRASIKICIYDKLQYGCDKVSAALDDISSMTTDQTDCGQAAAMLRVDTILTGVEGESYLQKSRSQMLKEFSEITKNCR